MTRSHGSSPSLLKMIMSGRIDNLLNEMDELVLQVRSNPQLKLYDYSVMYREIS